MEGLAGGVPKTSGPGGSNETIKFRSTMERDSLQGKCDRNGT